MSLFNASSHLRVAVYLRVSTEEQAREGHSLDAQLKICLAFAEQRGWTVAAVFRDPDPQGAFGSDEKAAQQPAPLPRRRRKASSSGKNDQRPGFQKMIAAVRRGQADVVLTHKLDRFSRSITDILMYLREFNELGVAYTSATEQFDFTTPIGKVLLTLLAAFAEWYLDNLSAETKKGKRERAEKGYWNGDLPFGYRNKTSGRDDVPDDAEPDPAAAPGAVMAFTEYAKGGRTDLDIADLLNAAGHRTKGKRGSIPFSKDTVRSMLRNPFYCGKVTYRGEVLTGRHAPLISEALFEKCQAVRRRARAAPRKPNPRVRTYPLAGLVYCWHCRRAHRAQVIHEYRYYRDVDRDYGGACPQKRYQRASELEDAVAGLLMALKLPDHWQAAVAAAAAENLEGDSTERRRARAEAKIKRAQELYIESLSTRAEYDLACAEARAELESLRPVAQPDVARAARLLTDLPRLWSVANEREKKTLLQAMLERVYVSGPKVEAIQPPPDLYKLLRLVYSGPDGIRTRDLGLDRAACLAATPRVQGSAARIYHKKAGASTID